MTGLHDSITYLPIGNLTDIPSGPIQNMPPNGTENPQTVEQLQAHIATNQSFMNSVSYMASGVSGQRKSGNNSIFNNLQSNLPFQLVL